MYSLYIHTVGTPLPFTFEFETSKKRDDVIMKIRAALLESRTKTVLIEDEDMSVTFVADKIVSWSVTK